MNNIAYNTNDVFLAFDFKVNRLKHVEIPRYEYHDNGYIEDAERAGKAIIARIKEIRVALNQRGYMSTCTYKMSLARRYLPNEPGIPNVHAVNYLYARYQDTNYKPALDFSEIRVKQLLPPQEQPVEPQRRNEDFGHIGHPIDTIGYIPWIYFKPKYGAPFVYGFDPHNNIEALLEWTPIAAVVAKAMLERIIPQLDIKK